MEDLRSQLVTRTDMETRLVEDNRVLQQMVMRADTEKKRLSMENEQLSWKMSQSFIGPREFNVLNTPDGEYTRNYGNCLNKLDCNFKLDMQTFQTERNLPPSQAPVQVI